MAMSKQAKLNMCIGCRQNFYNGNNPIGIKECWSLATAKVVKKKKVGIWERPPWRQEPIEILSCRTEQGYVFVDAKQIQ